MTTTNDPNAFLEIAHNQTVCLDEDDHPQYALLAGRAGGQQLNGGVDPDEELTLRGTSDSTLGLIKAQSPIDFGDVTGANGLSPYSVRDASAASFSSPFIGGTFGDTRTVDFSNGVFIYETLRGAPTITSMTSPNFAAFTLFNAIPTLKAGPGADNNPLQALFLNAGGIVYSDRVGTRTCANITGVNVATTIQGAASGATMNVTNYTGMTVSPTWNTVSGSSINFGTVRGMWMRPPMVALFGTSAGTEAMNAYIGMDVEPIAFGGDVTKRALRSWLTPANNTLMIENMGGADSDFGAGDIMFDTNAGVVLGDVRMTWDGSALLMEPESDDSLTIDGSDELRLGHKRFAFGQVTEMGNQTGVFVAQARSAELTGEWVDWLFTSSDNLDLDGNSMSGVYGAAVNAPSVTLSGGSAAQAAAMRISGNVGVGDDRYGLLIQSNPSGGSGDNHALHVNAGMASVDDLEIRGALAPLTDAYSVTGTSTDRDLDSADVLSDVIDVLGTLIGDLKAANVLP